jgi:cobalamin biosynthesis protein CobT
MMSKVNKERFNIPLLAKILGNQMGLSVIFSRTATTASINMETKVITLPEAMCNSGQTSDVVLIRGFIAHEAVGHGRHTDMNTLLKIKSKFEASLINILEDIRIEKAAWKCYPGVRSIISELVDYLVQDEKTDFFGQFIEEDKFTQLSQTQLLHGYLLTYLRATCLKQSINFDLYEQAARDAFGDDLMDKVVDIALKSEHAKSTEGIYVLANQIIDLLKENAPEDEEEGDGAQGNGQSESDDDKVDSKGAGNDKGDEEESGKDEDGSGGSGDDSDDDSGNAEANSDETGDEGEQQSSQQQSTSKQSSPHIQQNVKELLASADSADVKTGLEEMIAEMIEEVAETFAKESRQGFQKQKIKVIQQTPSYDENGTYTFLRANSVKLSSRLEDLLEAKVEESEELASSGMLSSRKMPKIKLLDAQVFTRDISETEGLNTSVFILGDMSGSMQGTEAACLMDSVLSLGTSLDKNDVPFGVSFFNDNAYEVKQFNERFPKVKGRIQQVYTPGGSTPIFESMVYAAGKAIETDSQRKVLLVITDGTFSNRDIDIEAFKNTLDKYQKDLEVRFVLIGDNMHNTHKYLVDNKIMTGVAKNSSEICKAVFDSLKNVF